MAPKGYRHSPETRAKISEATKGLKRSEETKQRMRDAWERRGGGSNKGKKFSAEHRAKISEGQRGKKRGPMPAETRAKISAANKGKPKSAEHRANMSKSRRGKQLFPECREKCKKSLKRAKMSPEACRNLSLSKQGEKNPRWRGGVSFEPYCIKFNNEFRERVRNFFGRVCVECGKSESEIPGRICVHHVNFRKDACCDDSVLPLFVTLCPSCHSKTQSDRGYWEEKYTTLINEEYGGRCYLPKSEVQPVLTMAQ